MKASSDVSSDILSLHPENHKIKIKKDEKANARKCNVKFSLLNKKNAPSLKNKMQTLKLKQHTLVFLNE